MSRFTDIRRILINGRDNVVSIEELDEPDTNLVDFIDFDNLENFNNRQDVILHPIIVGLAHNLMVGNILSLNLEEEQKVKLTEDEFKNLETCSDVTNCAICFENKKSNIKLKCNHIFCKTCIKKWLTEKSNTCPTCRTEI